VSETIVKRARKLQGVLTPPGDKSISHRAALLSLLCSQPMTVVNFSDSDDCRRSLEAVQALGGVVEMDQNTHRLTPPQDGLRSPEAAIDCGNSGTTMRLLAGLLAGAGTRARLIGDESLSGRPMQRIVDPLHLMNADIASDGDGCAPLAIGPATLIPIDYILPVASAQVKSALLLAGLASGCPATIREKTITRDHTERMIRHLGGQIAVEDVKPVVVVDPEDPRKKKKTSPTTEYKRTITLIPTGSLAGGTVEIPGDASTAAFFVAAALMIPGSHLIIKDVGVNPTRSGFRHLVKQMGADIVVKNRREVCGEPVGDIEVRYSRLKPRKISGEAISALIDELPIVAVLAATLEGTTIIRDAGELRHKESDRIKALVENLNAMGVKVGEFPDGLAIEGGGELNGAEIDCHRDHRIAMAFAVAGLAAHGKTIIKESDVVAFSCPQFFTLLDSLRVT
jgi:3-phosphoshikimate 1-carboxyvinyltransferase